MKISLGAKKDIYTGSRCMTSGILLGRMAYGLASFTRALEDKTSWSPHYAVHMAAEPAYEAAKQLEKILPNVRPGVKQFMGTLEEHKDYGSTFGFNKERASKALETAKKQLAAIAQVAVKDCGKRRPAEGEGEALLRNKKIKTPRAFKAPEIPMELPAFVPDAPVAESSGAPWGILAGVVMVIGATFLAGAA